MFSSGHFRTVEDGSCLQAAAGLTTGSTCLIYLVYLLNNAAAHRLSDLLSGGCLQPALRLLPTGRATGIEPVSKLAYISPK